MKLSLRPFAVLASTTLPCALAALALLLVPAVPAGADTLRDIYELALRNDARLKAAEATYRANLEVEKQARGALLPQVIGEASYTDRTVRQTTEGVDVDQGTITPRTQRSRLDTDREMWGVSLQQRIFDLPAWFSFQSGRQTSLQAEAQLAADQQDLIVRVAEAYFNVLRAIDNLEASQAEERAVQRQLDQTQQRFEVGLIPITDVHEARAAYDNTVVLRLGDEGSLATAYESLATLTGQHHTRVWTLDPDFPVTSPDPLDRAEWVDFALANNFSLQAAQYEAEASRQTATARRMEHLPKITGSLSYTDESIDGTRRTRPDSPFSTGPDADIETESIGIRLEMPLFSGGQISAQRRRAHELYNASLQRAIDTQRAVIRDARAQHIAVATDVARVRARQQAIVSSQSALDATQAGYEVGNRNIVDVLQAQRNLFASLRDYANARYDYVINQLRLKQVAGTLSPQDIIDLNQWLVEPDAPTANTYRDFRDPEDD